MKLTTNFRKTLETLKKFVSEKIETDRDRAGVIQAFKFTFEQAWKSIQKVASSQGSQVANPKSSFQYAMQNGWIDQENEKIWLNMIKDRNLTSHTYQEDYAKSVLKNITENYIDEFESLLTRLEKA